MKILLTGKTGQLAQAILRTKPEKIEIIPLSREELDLIDEKACFEYVIEHKPDWVINTAAYTYVDKAEKEPDKAIFINANAPKAFSKALNKTGGKLLQISTDYVFNGCQSYPYLANQETSPNSVYGLSKALGEKYVLNYLEKDKMIIFRTSWLYGTEGNNFLLTMLRLHQEKDEIKVVSDQISCPTSTDSLALAIWQSIKLSQENRLHNNILHWSDAGSASWYDFSFLIGDLAEELGLINKAAKVTPIPTKLFPMDASRPNYSLLDCSETRLALNIPYYHWTKSLKEVLKAIILKSEKANND